MAQGDFVSEDENSFTIEGPEGFERIAKTPGTVQQMNALKASGRVSGQFSAPPPPPAPAPAPTPGILPKDLAPQQVSPLRPGYKPVAEDLGTDSAGFNPAYEPAAQGMGGGMMPASMTVQTPAQSTTVQQKSLSPEARKSIDLAFESQRKAVESQMAAEQAAAKQQAELYGAMQGEYEASYKKQNEALEAKRRVYDAQREQFNESVKRFTEAKMKDPVAEQDIASKLGAAIAVGLGAYASAKTGGPNTALQIINSSIERAMQLQKMDIAKKGEEVNLRRNDLALLKEEMGDIEHAEAAFRAGLLEKTKMQVQIASDKSKSDVIKAKGAQLMAAIDAEKAKILADFDSSVVSRVDQSGGMNVSYGPSSKYAASPLDTPLGRAYNETAANKVHEIVYNMNKANYTLNNFNQKLEKYGTVQAWGTKAKGEYQEAIDQVTETLRAASSAGTLQPSEREAFEKRFAGIKTPEQVKAYITSLQATMDSNIRAAQKSYIRQPIGAQSATYQPM